MTPEFLRAEAKLLRARACEEADDPSIARELLLLAEALEKLATAMDGKSIDGHE